MKNKILNLYKPLGATPLQRIIQFQLLHPEFRNIKLGYAGRLDPMAEGVLLVLVGDENKKKQQYEQLSKDYVCDMLFGIETDTYDILGKIVHIAELPKIESLEKTATQLLSTYQRKIQQRYPPYSSKTVKGKPLYWWARENKLDEIKVPEHEVEIFSLTITKTYTVKAKEAHAMIIERIGKTNGNFRQEEIAAIWDAFFQTTDIPAFPLIQYKIACSSGTYIRTLVHDIGKQTDYGAISFNLMRTKVGIYSLESSIR